MTGELVGSRSYLTLADEEEWGAFMGASGSATSTAGQGTATYYHVPVNSYTVMATRLTRNSQAYTGTHQRKHASSFGANVAGQLVTHVHGFIPTGTGSGVSLARKLIDWGFGDFEVDRPSSKSAEWAEGPNTSNRRHTGLIPNSSTLTGNSDSGEILLTMDLIGKEEFAGPTAQTLPDDREKIVDMQMYDMTLLLGSTVVEVTAFQHQVNRNLQGLRTNTWWITGLSAGMRDETLTVTIPKKDATYDVYRRLQNSDTEITATLTIRGLHNGTGASGNYTKLSRVFNRLFFQAQDLQGDKGILLQPLTFQCLKPDSSSNTHTDTWSLV